MKVPQELIDYMQKLILPPGGEGLVCMDLSELDTTGVPDNHLHAAIIRGTPTEAQSKELMRILRPGAHMCLIAPEDQPTGHTGAIRLEDEGFEIRDAIAWVRREGSVHYVPKVTTKTERHAGTGGHNNDHVTVKPIDLMRRLLEDLPEDADVADFFMGSGSTGIAAVKTGHNFIGFEMREHALRIAEGRIRHWDAEEFGWTRANIISDLDEETEEEVVEEPMSLSDLFGFGGEEV